MVPDQARLRIQCREAEAAKLLKQMSLHKHRLLGACLKRVSSIAVAGSGGVVAVAATRADRGLMGSLRDLSDRATTRRGRNRHVNLLAGHGVRSRCQPQSILTASDVGMGLSNLIALISSIARSSTAGDTGVLILHSSDGALANLAALESCALVDVPS